MAVKNVGTLIREARTAKKLSQEQVANGITGLTGSDLGKAERGEKELSQAQLKAIAKALGITQKSLLEAPKGGASAAASAAKTAAAKKTASTTAKKTTAAKTTAAKTAAAKTTAAKTATAKTAAAKKTTTAAKTTAAAKKTTAASKAASALTLSAAEKSMIELYRKASSDNKKLATRILKGEKLEVADLLPMLSEDGLLGSLLGKLQGR